MTVDEVAYIEKLTDVPVIQSNRFMDLLKSNHWNTLLRSEKKIQQHEKLVLAVRKYVPKHPGYIENIHMFRNTIPNVPLEMLAESLGSFATKLEMDLKFIASEVDANSIFLCKISSKSWVDLIEKDAGVTTEILEETVSALKKANLGIVVFTDYDESPPLLQSFAQSLLKDNEVAVYLISSLPGAEALEQGINNPNQPIDLEIDLYPGVSHYILEKSVTIGGGCHE